MRLCEWLFGATKRPPRSCITHLCCTSISSSHLIPALFFYWQCRVLIVLWLIPIMVPVSSTSALVPCRMRELPELRLGIIRGPGSIDQANWHGGKRTRMLCSEVGIFRSQHLADSSRCHLSLPRYCLVLTSSCRTPSGYREIIHRHITRHTARHWCNSFVTDGFSVCSRGRITTATCDSG
jgi:hypothetical protein